MTTTSGPGFASSARRTAVSSMRLFVVSNSPPLSWCVGEVAHAQPPGPGFPLHAPSVKTRGGAESGIGPAWQVRIDEQPVTMAGSGANRTRRGHHGPMALDDDFVDQLYDSDPDETKEWLDSFDAVHAQRGDQR